MNAPVPAEPLRLSVSPAPLQAAARAPGPVAVGAKGQPSLTELTAVPAAPWRALHDRAIEPNAYYDPLWAVPVSRFARRRRDALALLAFDRSEPDRLTGLMPVRWAKKALSLPVPMLVGWNGYAALAIPTLDRDHAKQAAHDVIDAAREAGARALFLPGAAIEGQAFGALQAALSEQGLSFEVLKSFRRATLDATQPGDETLKVALGAKKLKELRRQRNRLEDDGPLRVEIAQTPEAVAKALEAFLWLEKQGWKGERGTGLGQDDGDTAFIRGAATALAAERRFEIVALTRNGATLASGLILRDRDHAYFFKIAMDEKAARTSPGVQLTLDLTRHLCADPAIRFADSSADGEHPMIDHVWRGRLAIADVFIPLHSRDPMAAGIKQLVRARYAAIACVHAVRRYREKMS